MSAPYLSERHSSRHQHRLLRCSSERSIGASDHHGPTWSELNRYLWDWSNCRPLQSMNSGGRDRRANRRRRYGLPLAKRSAWGVPLDGVEVVSFTGPHGEWAVCEREELAQLLDAPVARRLIRPPLPSASFFGGSPCSLPHCGRLYGAIARCSGRRARSTAQ